MNEKLQPDTNMAKKFLTLISQGNESKFTFQIFNDKKNEEDNFIYPHILNGTFEEYEQKLILSQQKGAGVFVTINETDGKGRKTENIIGVRAVYVDLDGSPLTPIFSAPLEPHIIIESSPGRFHVYWLVEGVELSDFTMIQKNLIARYEGDPKVHDLSRVMRLPGFYHQKEAPFLTKIIHENCAKPISISEFMAAFEIEVHHEFESSYTNTLNDVNPVLEALKKREMLLTDHSDGNSCWIIRCPWESLHTRKDNGTKYYEPNKNGYPSHGFKCFHDHCKSKRVKDLLTFLGIENEYFEPQPLYRGINPPSPFPTSALGEVLGSAVQAMCRIIQAPDSVCAQSVLATVSLITQSLAKVHIDGREILLSEFYLTVAESGDRKSAADNAALKPIRNVQEALSAEYPAKLAKYAIQKEAWEARKKEWLKEVPCINATFTESAPKAPMRPLILAEEPTYEGIVKYYAGEGRPSIGLFSDEGGRFFGGHGMKKEDKLKTLTGLSSIWDGKEISRMRAGDGNELLFGRVLSLHLMVQECIFSELMNDSMMESQGFLPRCLIAFPQTMVGTRIYVEKNLSQEVAIQEYYSAANRLLQLPFLTKPLPASQNELDPRSITLSSEAKQLWIEFHNKNEEELAEGMRYHSIRRFASKAPEHVLRLSGALTIFGNPNAIEIDRDGIQRGIRIVEYYMMERLRINGYAAINQDLICAQSLLHWFWREGYTEVNLSLIYQLGPSELRTAEKARKIMQILTIHGWVLPIRNITIDGKKYREGWHIISKD